MILLQIGLVKGIRALNKTTKLERFLAEVPDALLNQIQAEFSQWILALLRHQVQTAIKTQKFPRQYKPLNPDYKAHKAKAGLKPGFWQATEFLSQQIKIWDDDGTFHLGWPPSLLHPHSKIPVSNIAERLEKGDPAKNLPPRPLFTPLADNIAKGIVRYFATFVHGYYPQYYPLLEPGPDTKPLALVGKAKLLTK